MKVWGGRQQTKAYRKDNENKKEKVELSGQETQMGECMIVVQPRFAKVLVPPPPLYLRDNAYLL